MFIGLGAGAIAATASGFPESSAKGSIHSVDEGLFYKVVIKLCVAINKLQVASRGMFCPKNGSPGYIVVPKSDEWMLDQKNQYGTSVRNFCWFCWPKMGITNPEDITDVYKDGRWVEERLPSDTWGIIDGITYALRTSGEDSFVTFKV